MTQQLTHYNETASQTGGPYVHIGLAPLQAGFEIFQNNFDNLLAEPGTNGERIAIEGSVTDGSGTLVRDALIEIWQADAQGHYAHPADAKPSSFRGWGRTGTDFETGTYRFETIKPGPVPGRAVGKTQAPHIALVLFARGINSGLHTRLYFSDEAAANAADPVLNSIEWEARRATLVARREQRGSEVVYRFDIRLQSPDPALETVFFDI
jgi:protocatechuate 3,4-dioxygenase alpha subunit